MVKKADEIEWNKLSKSGKANLYLLKDQFDTFIDGMEHKGWEFFIFACNTFILFDNYS